MSDAETERKRELLERWRERESKLVRGTIVGQVVRGSGLKDLIKDEAADVARRVLDRDKD